MVLIPRKDMNSRYKWWIYTVVLGLLPFFARTFIFLVMKQVEPYYILNEIDMVAFGLVMATANINDLEGNNRFDPNWKGVCIGSSVVLVVFMSLILGVAYFMDARPVDYVDRTKIKICSLVLSIISFIFSLAIVYKPNYQTNNE